jgi:hypothetical protein
MWWQQGLKAHRDTSNMQVQISRTYHAAACSYSKVQNHALHFFFHILPGAISKYAVPVVSRICIVMDNSIEGGFRTVKRY